ncbi:MAG: hypothetical protein SGILL_009082, partial [Bacillariaceae sp.]
TDAAYASFATGETVILMVLLGEEENFIQEVDLPPVEVPGVLPGMMSRDMVTHGCFMIAKSGIALRSRYMPQELSSPSKRARLEVRSGSSDHVPVPTLVSHLRAHFWECYKNPTVDRPMPPSLLQSDSNREKAIVDVAVELQRKGGTTSPSIAMEWHDAFVKMVLDGGLYRCLSNDSKWNMFAVGQEISVCKEIADALLHKHKHADVDWLESLQPYDLGGWFLKIQANEEATGWQNIAVWHDILNLAFDAFWKFRDEMAEDVYDTRSEHGPVSWISRENMQNLLRRQLNIFKANPASVPPSVVEVVVKTALFSFHQTWFASKDDQSEKEQFAKMQKTCISLLRMTNDGNDETAFDLCMQYEYFEGLCDISLAHERKVDAKSYALDPLFGTLKSRDLLNKLTFPQFVLLYHADRRLYGHVINYGRNCINDLNLIMEQNDSLRQYRWISSIRQGHFDQATKFCLQNCEESMDIDKTQWNLSFAKLSNKLVASQNQQVVNRQKEIEKKLDLVEAQQLLKEDEADMDIVLPPEKLIDLALNKLADSYDMESRIKFAMVALAVCAILTDENMVFEFTSKVWSECLLLNGAQWTEWSHYGMGEELEGVREEALTETVFGLVLSECRKDNSLAKVTYGRHIESEVIDRVQGDENRESFTRLLRTVATPTETVIGESMMVSSF